MEHEERLKAALADRYWIEREIGSGGMATVYLAQDLKHRRKVAVKVLKPDLSGILGPERFLREIEITARLRHPHILPLLDSGEAEGLLFYVMPFVEGESLRDRLKRELQLPIDDSVKIGLEVADALGYAHDQGVIHRDVKPENILLEAGHAVVADFGVANAVTVAGSDRLTQTGIVVGTPAYLSPEQATGDQEIDGRSDVYATGCILYEMLTGEPPITGPTVAAVLARKATELPPSADERRSSVPTELAKAVQRALAPVPGDRYTTATEFSKDLEAIRGSGPIVVGRKGRRGSRFAIPLAALLVITVAGALLWNQLSRGAPAADTATTTRVIAIPYENETGDPSLDPIGRMTADWLTEGLAQTGEVHAVPTLMVMQTLGQVTQGEGQASPLRLAQSLEAGIAVTGSYYLFGDSLEFHSTVVDVASGAPFGVVDPVRGPSSDPMQAIDAVCGRVVGLLATRLSWHIGWELPPSVRPPLLEASQTYARAMDDFLQGYYSDAADGFSRAYALDTTYLRALVMAAAAYSFAGRPAQLDSVLQIPESRRQELAPYDRLRVDIMAAGLEGDLTAQWDLSRRAIQMVPIGTQRWAFIWSLVEQGRPREALEDLESDLEALRAAFGPWYRFWDLHTRLYHLLGEHERELELAREGQEQIPNFLPMLTYEGRALAALGRLEELGEVVDRILGLRVPSSTTPGHQLLILANELRAHGYWEAAVSVLEEGRAWFERQDPDWRASGTGRLLYGRQLYGQERWVEADAVFESFAEDSAHDPTYLGYRGTIAAHLGNEEDAREYDAQLAQLDPPYAGQRAGILQWRADIAALLDEREEAMRLLNQRMTVVGWGAWLHLDTDLESLHDYPPFMDLLEPTG